jgi:hypothetical protein
MRIRYFAIDVIGIEISKVFAVEVVLVTFKMNLKLNVIKSNS